MGIFMKKFYTVVFLAGFAFADISVSIDALSGEQKISPYIYGRNIDVISDAEGADAEQLSKEKDFYSKMLESGMHFLRSNNGNNATRYNWRKKMTVHPDWFNNVYSHDWDVTAKKLIENMPGVDAMYAFQLTGYAASTTDYNFGEWDYKVSHGFYPTSTLDLAGGGEVSDDGKTLLKAGDYRLYNEPWPADSTVGIIEHWRDELKFDMSRFTYWSMDNEMEIWSGTHGDLPLDIDADFLVERYIDVAKKARAKWSGIKLTGPVVANEWQWCSVGATGGKSGLGKGEDRNYCWLEYFIKRLAEEEKSSGVKMLDVFDMHWYPTETSYEERVNWHRVFFDMTYNYSGANGIKMVNGSWDNKQTKEYIFKRVRDWLDKYFGKDHGITLGLTETSIIDETDPMTTAITYASWLGTFMDHGVEIFSPWTWGDGMYETVHLFSRYGHGLRVASTSSNDSLLSAYTSVSAARDSMTVILVNRAEKESQNVSIEISGLKNMGANATTLTLAGITGETFKSHTENALKAGTASVASNKVTLTVPAKSITAVMLTADAVTRLNRMQPAANVLFSQGNAWFVNNSSGSVHSAQVYSALGRLVKNFDALSHANVSLETEKLPRGSYMIRLNTASGFKTQKILVK